MLLPTAWPLKLTLAISIAVSLSACGDGGSTALIDDGNVTPSGTPGPTEPEVPSNKEPVDTGGSEPGTVTPSNPSPQPPNTPTPPESIPEPQVLKDGTWGGVINWPHIPVHIANLPDGRLVTWASFEPESWNKMGSIKNYTVSTVYDPATNAFTDVHNGAHDMFCAGISLLENGNIMASGGNPTNRNTSIFNLSTDRWDPVAQMNHSRWYGTTVTLPDGDVFATFAEGADDFGEVYSQNDQLWYNKVGTDMSTLRKEEALADAQSGYSLNGQWYAYMHVMPDGSVFQAGPTETMHIFNTEGQGGVTEVGKRPDANRHIQFGTSTSHMPGKILITGGSDFRRNPVTTDEALVVDFDGAAPTTRRVQAMHYPRVFHDAVTLANGEVMIIGGNTNGMIFEDDDSVMVSEIFDPKTETWRKAAPISIPRTYHSVAILMKDGRVISGGGGLCGRGCEANHPDAQIYTPGYLYNLDGSPAKRPQLQALSSEATAGDALGLVASERLSRVTMVRLSGTTHSINTDQRFLELEFDQETDGSYSAYLHDNPNVLIPGNYWVFGFNYQGVPSVGVTIKITAPVI